ncbi:MAG: hypothetical protein AAAFM81_10565 [Pseudomonadota bacterium]
MISNDKPDFERYTTEELRLILSYIDRDAYPERLDEVRRILLTRETDELTRDALKAALDEDAGQSTSPLLNVHTAAFSATSTQSARKAHTSSSEKGAATFAGALMEVIFAAVFLFVAVRIFSRQEDPAPWWYVLAFLSIAVGFVGDALLRFIAMFKSAGLPDDPFGSSSDTKDPMSDYLNAQDKRR